MLVNPFVFGGGGPPAGTLDALILADLTTYGAGYYFRHDEPSGTAMVNQVGANGSYAGVTLGQSPLYSGGGTSVLINGGDGSLTSATPILVGQELSILTIVNFNSIAGMVAIFCSDDGASRRAWQWRTDGGTGMQWVKIAGGVNTITTGSVLSTGVPLMLGVDISDSGTPGTSDIVFYVNGSAVHSTIIPTANYGSIYEALQVGACAGGGLVGNARFSESAIIPASIGASRWAAYAAAAGL